jgi:hypothetical protein
VPPFYHPSLVLPFSLVVPFLVPPFYHSSLVLPFSLVVSFFCHPSRHSPCQNWPPSQKLLWA